LWTRFSKILKGSDNLNRGIMLNWILNKYVDWVSGWSPLAGSCEHVLNLGIACITGICLLIINVSGVSFFVILETRLK
jgi:hypothetical protein